MYRQLSIVIITSGAWWSSAAVAEGFIEGSTARLEARDFYYNGDLREGAGQSKREEWAQGFLLNYESGFTQGTVGLGIDATAFAGFKLDSSSDRTGSGLLPQVSSGEAADDYSKGGLTAKVKMSNTTLRYGLALPKVPVLQFNGSRLFPQTFWGTQLSSREIEGLTFNFAQFDKTVGPDSTDRQDIGLAAKAGRYVTTGVGDRFRYGGVSYQVTPSLTASYYYGDLEDVYSQKYLGLMHIGRVGAGTLTTDLRAFTGRNIGASRAGNVDNQAYAMALGYSLDSGHSVLAAYQVMAGDTGFPFVNNPYLPNYVQYHDFASAGERSWQLRYGYDFKHVGIPGLSFFTAYIRGDGLDKPGTDSEWERDFDVTYAFQERLKGLTVRWRNATYRSSDGRDMTENRLIASYAFSLF